MYRAGIIIALLLGPAWASVFAADPTNDLAEADARLLKEAGVENNGPSLLKYFESRLISDADRGKVESLIRQLGDDSFAERESASAELDVFGPAIVGLLKAGLRDPDTEIVRRCERLLRKAEKVPSATLAAAAARGLARLKPERTSEVLLAWLPLADDEAVADELRTALTATAIRDGKADERLVKALTDPSAARRGSAVEALVRAAPMVQAEAARKLLKDDDPEVRLRAALALATYAKDKPAVAVLVDLLVDLPAASGWRAEEALVRLAGQDAPKVSLGSTTEQRRKAKEEWQAWWAKAGDKVDLAKLADGPRYLGYTLVMQLSLRGTNGRIIELGLDKQPRWKIENLSMPLDARVLPGDRVLIAEHNAHKVTERDLTGKIVWEKAIQMPIACDRLPNGNTFMAGRNQILEVSADGKDVFTYARPAQDIVAATRSRTGEYVFVTNTGNCVRVNAAGKEVKSFAVGQANYYSGMEILPNGNILLSQIAGVAEFDPENGKEVWRANIQQPTCAHRLPNGNTLTTSTTTRKVVELDREGKTAWEYDDTEGFRPWKARRR